MSTRNGNARSSRRQPTRKNPVAVPLAPDLARLSVPRSPGSGNRPGPTPSSAGAVAGSLDYPLLAILATLLALGPVMVYSASFSQHGESFFLRQIAWTGVGILVLAGAASIPLGWWKRGAIPLMGITLVLLGLVLIVGDDPLGAQRTLFRGRVQPSEIAKLAVVIYVSAWVSTRGRKLSEVRTGLLPFAILMGLVTGLIVLEPSFSVSIIILTIGVVIFFVGGGDTRQLLIVGGIAAIVLLALLSQFHYAIDRIEKWWQMLTDPAHASDYALIQHLLARGFRISLFSDPTTWAPKALQPLLWSDYLFVNIGHDLGLLGTIGVIGMFAGLGYRGLGIALRAPDQFSALAAVGVTTWILTQAVIHIGTSLALIPATGQPLPFLSYGGSSLVSCMAGIGLLLGISRASRAKDTVHAHSAVGRRDGRPRVSDPVRGERPAPERRPEAKRPAGGQSEPRERRPGTEQRREHGRGSSGNR